MKWLIAASFAFAAGSVAAADLQIVVEDIESSEGSVRLALYNDPKTFRKEEKSLTVLSKDAAEGSLEFLIEGLDPGRYALIVYHDADGNGKMNRFLGMIPTEGYGLSNNPEVSGPPAFEDAVFELNEEGGRVEVILRY
ncbi:MAG: DUF2141 domain-containing protein [Pseudomonadota bacterium]